MSVKRFFSFDFGLFLLCSLIVFATWPLFFQHHSSQLVSGNDGNLLYLFMGELVKGGGNWQSIIYTPKILGGTSVLSTTGLAPLIELLISWGFGPITLYNFLIFQFQILLAFFSLKSTIIFYHFWKKPHGPWKKISFFNQEGKINWNLTLKLAALIAVFSFSPLMGWRIAYGHSYFLYGMLPILVVISFLWGVLPFEEEGSKVSPLQLFLSFWTFAQCFPTMGQQLAIYSLIFLSPVIFMFIYDLRKNKWNSRKGEFLFLLKTFSPLLMIFLAALVVSSPIIYEIVTYFLAQGEAARSLNGENLTYSYHTWSLYEFVTSLFWFPLNSAHVHEKFIWHEVFYPGLSFVLLSIYGLFKNKKRNWGIYSLVIFSLVLILSMNISPLSDGILEMIPILKSLRVPARSLIPILSFAMIIFFSMHINFHEEKVLRREHVLQGGFIFLFIFAISKVMPEHLKYPMKFLFEMITWISLSLVLGFKTVVQKTGIKGDLNGKGPLNLKTFGLLLFALMSTISFGMRLMNFQQTDNLAKSFQYIEESLEKEYNNRGDSLHFPLQRHLFNFSVNGMDQGMFNYNKSFLMNSLTLDGLHSPTGRFLNLMNSLNKEKNYHSTEVLFTFNSNMPHFKVLQGLYNIRTEILSHSNELRVNSLIVPSKEGALGGAWFSKEIVWQRNYTSLGENLLGEKENLNSLLREKMFVLKEEESSIRKRFPELLNFKKSPDCAQSKVNKLSYVSQQGLAKGELLHLEILNQKTPCPLTLSLNYGHNMVIYAQTADRLVAKLDPVSLPIFPAHGALVGVMVPPQPAEQTLKLVLVPRSPLWMQRFSFLGYFLIGLLLIYPYWKRRKDEVGEKVELIDASEMDHAA